MSRTINISDKAYEKFVRLANLYGFESVEQYLNDDLQVDSLVRERQKELDRRREVGNEIREFQEKMRKKYGVMPDSAALVREDRER